jgi:two-component system sensor histidine kinase BaeS
MPSFRSLTFKLTLAFLLVGLTGAVLVAIIIQTRTRVAFGQFIINQQQQTLADTLAQYYQSHGSWEGIADNLQSILIAPPPDTNNGRNFQGDRLPFILVGANRIALLGGPPDQIGKQVSGHELEQAIPITDNNQTVGWIVPANANRPATPGSPEGRFLQDVNSATMLSALVAILLALTLGSVLAFTMTRSLRELTEATLEIARGKLGMQVKVRSKDELGKLAESFNQMSLDLAQATQVRRQMTADIAHDLRSPLSVIAGYAEALSDGKLPGTPEVYTILYQQTKHLNRMVDDLRTLSLADAGELPLSILPTSPKSILERAYARHAMAAEQKQITLRLDAVPDELPDVAVDAERMAQVLDNLILNAFRYTPPGGEVTLLAKVEDGTVQLQVRDNGSGIAAEDLHHIFDRFYRGDKSRQQSGESGLGLAISKSIVEAHQGAITVESVQGQGSTFTITLKADDT